MRDIIETYTEEELDEIGLDAVDYVQAYGGWLEIVCLRRDGAWSFVAVLGGEVTIEAFEPPPGWN